MHEHPTAQRTSTACTGGFSRASALSGGAGPPEVILPLAVPASRQSETPKRRGRCGSSGSSRVATQGSTREVPPLRGQALAGVGRPAAAKVRLRRCHFSFPGSRISSSVSSHTNATRRCKKGGQSGGRRVRPRWRRRGPPIKAAARIVAGGNAALGSKAEAMTPLSQNPLLQGH